MNSQSALTVTQQREVSEALYAEARRFVPEIRGLARDMEKNRRLDDALVGAMDAAGLFSIVTPVLWGGAGLGPRELNQVLEIIGSADCSTAWITGFFNYHNFFLCRFPRETQEQIYKGRSSAPCAATFAPPGRAERVDGGYRISGRWPYCSGVWHATYVLLACAVDGEVCWFIVDRNAVETIDDWEMAGMAATGSISVAVDKLFVPDGWWSPLRKIMSADDHDGTFHVEPVYRYPFSALGLANASFTLGALDAAVELGGKRLRTSRPQGVERIEHPAARIRWAEAYEAAKVMRFLRDGATEEAIARAESGRPQTMEDEARAGLHGLALMHGVKDAFRKLVDGSGSSIYKSDDPVRRAANDVAMISTHALGPDYDVHIDRHARWLLGYGEAPTDPKARFA